MVATSYVSLNGLFIDKRVPHNYVIPNNNEAFYQVIDVVFKNRLIYI